MEYEEREYPLRFGDFGYRVIPEGTLQIIEYLGHGGSVQIPGEIEGMSVAAIGTRVFKKCTTLTHVEIPEGVTRIGEFAFSGCSNLKSVSLPGGIREISGWAFENCPELSAISIPGSIEIIGDWAFVGCEKLTSITLSKGLKYIGHYAFRGCDHLTDVYFSGNRTAWKKLIKGPPTSIPFSIGLSPSARIHCNVKR